MGEQPGFVDKLKGMMTGDKAALGAGKYRRVHVVINPAAGKEEKILNTLNDVFHRYNIDWEAYVTHDAGDAQNLTENAIRDQVDAVVVYGGDGTVMEVVAGLEGRDIPVAILPGGTANLLAKEMGIPLNLKDSAELLAAGPTRVQPVDMGVAGGYLFFRLGIGFQGELAQLSNNQGDNSNSNLFSYLFSMLRQIREPSTATYKLTIEGKTMTVDAIGCMVTTYGKTMVSGLTLSHNIDPTDGLLDVVLIQEANLKTLFKTAANAIASGEMADGLIQYQVSGIEISADPPQPIMRDGELIKPEMLDVRVVPQAAQLIVPVA